jgi:hypothetical protein
MTHRAGEPFTIKSLRVIDEIFKTNDRINSTARGNVIGKFYEFITDYIDASTISKLENGENDRFGSLIIPKDLYKQVDAIGFFDSLHDFKSDFMDCQGNIRGKNDILWNYKKFCFTFLLHGGYPDLITKYNLLIQTKYSYLNRIPRPLNQDNLENYFSIGNIYDIVKQQSNERTGDFYILPNTRENGINTEIYNNLITMFGKYKDPNFDNKIKLIVDFQLNLFEIIKVGRAQEDKKNEFCILYTAETITDPAPKATANTINDYFGFENWYIEHLDENTEREYNATNDDVKGNVDVVFKNIQISDPTNLDKAKFKVNVKYGIQTAVDVIMNAKANTIQTIKNLIRKTIELFPTNTDVFDYYGESIQNREIFYNRFNTSTLTEKDAIEYKDKYTVYYARKRLGDTLQGRVCKKDKQILLKFGRVTKNGKKYGISNDNIIDLGNKDDITDAVLVTHDRMLFSYAIKQIVPTILDLKDHMIVFIPKQQTN